MRRGHTLPGILIAMFVVGVLFTSLTGAIWHWSAIAVAGGVLFLVSKTLSDPPEKLR